MAQLLVGPHLTHDFGGTKGTGTLGCVRRDVVFIRDCIRRNGPARSIYSSGRQCVTTREISRSHSNTHFIPLQFIIRLLVGSTQASKPFVQKASLAIAPNVESSGRPSD